MPRDKKTIHRATSDIEDEEDADEEVVGAPDTSIEEVRSRVEETTRSDILKERKQILKNIILKRTLQLKKQCEKNRQQRVNSTQ